MSRMRRFTASLTAGVLLVSGAGAATADQPVTVYASASGSDFAAEYISVPSSLEPGEVGVYVVEGRNNGPNYGYNKIEITANGPVAEIATDDTLNCTNSDGTITCLDAISAGKSTPREYTIVASGPGEVSTTALITPFNGSSDPDMSNNSVTATTTVLSNEADLAVALDAAPGPLLTSRIDYDLTAANQGPADLTNATIEVQLPAQTSFVSNLSAGCSYDSYDDMVRCSSGAIANGTDTVKSFQANLGLLSVGPVPATASIVSSSPADQNAANNAASADCTVLTSLIITCN